MRLSKRLAVGVMAAVMALSMLTACGGGSNSGGSSSGKPGQGGSNSGSSSSSSTNTGSGNGENKDNTPTSNQNARSTKYYNRRDKMTRYTYKAQVEKTEDGKVSTTTLRVVGDGTRFSIQLWDSDGDPTLHIITDTKAKQVNYVYEGYLFQDDYDESSSNEAAPEYMKGVTMLADSRNLGASMTVGTTMVDGTLYYSETYENSGVTGTVKYVYCFDAGDLEGNHLRYVLADASVLLPSDGIRKESMKIKVFEDTSEVDYEALRIPEGYRIATGNEEVDTTPKDNYPN